MARRFMVLAILAFCGLVAVASAQAAVKPRTILVVPFETAGLSSDEQWIGEGAAQAMSLGLAQSPAFVQVERARLRAFGQPEAWGETAVLQAARSLRVDAALYGRVARTNNELVLQPKILELRSGSGEPVSMEPVTVADGAIELGGLAGHEGQASSRHRQQPRRSPSGVGRRHRLEQRRCRRLASLRQGW